MSMPDFPQDMTKIEWEQAMSMVVASIAMEELALSHLLNAEGEKLQYVLGTLHNNQSCDVSTGDILRVNESIGNVLDKVETNQILLKGKLELAIKAHQQQEKKIYLYQGIPEFCWRKNCPLPWMPEDSSNKNIPCCPLARIVLPTGGASLISYSLTLEMTCGERNITILLQRLCGNRSETLAVEDTHAFCQETVIHICGCVIAPPTSCGQDSCELEFVLLAPCSISVKEASLTITKL